MDGIVVFGFLGAGKTSLCRQILRELGRQQKKVAVIVNEIGTVGLDGAALSEVAADVWELANGCICCSLAEGLETALRNIKERGPWDMVLLEPSGASSPDRILPILRQAISPLGHLAVLSALDAARIDALIAVAAPLIETQTVDAQHVLITKADIATKAQIALAREFVERVCPDASVTLRTSPDAALPSILGLGNRKARHASNA